MACRKLKIFTSVVLFFVLKQNTRVLIAVTIAKTFVKNTFEADVQGDNLGRE